MKRLWLLVVIILAASAATSATAGAATSSEITYGCGSEGDCPWLTKSHARPKISVHERNRVRSETRIASRREGARGEGDGRLAPKEGGRGRNERTATSPRVTTTLRPTERVSTRRIAATHLGAATADIGAEGGGGVSPVLIVLIAVAALAVLSAGVAFFSERFRARRR